MGPRVTVVWSIGSRWFRGGQGGICGVSEPFPRHYFSRSHKVLSGYFAGCLEVDEHCPNITAAMHKDDKRCPEKKLYGKGRVKQAWSFMMPGFRHRNRPTKMHDKGERLKLRQRSLLRHPQSHHSGGHRDVLCILHFWVPSPSFPEGGANLGAGCCYLFAAVAVYGVFTGSGAGSVGNGDIFTRWGYSRRDTGGVSSSTLGGHSSHVFIGSGGGGGILDIFARGGCSSRASIGTGTGGVGSSTWGGHSSHVFIVGGGYVGGCGDIFPRRGHSRRSSSGGVTGGTHVSGSRVGPPAVVGASPTPPASDPSVGAGAATGELLATEAINVIVQFNGRFLLDILLLTQAPIFV